MEQFILKAQMGYINGMLHTLKGLHTCEIRLWPDPKALHFDQSRGSQFYILPAAPLLFKDYHLDDPDKQVADGCPFWKDQREALYELQKTVPVEYAAMIQPFHSHQYAMIRLLHLVPEYMDLLKSNPVLAYYFANQQQLRTDLIRNRVESIRELVFSNQKHILQFMNFPATRNMAKIFRKIPAESVTSVNVAGLRKRMTDNRVVKTLSHLPSINAGLLEIINDEKLMDICSYGFIAEMAEKTDDSKALKLVSSILDCMRMQEEVTPEIPLPRVVSIRQLSAMHDEILIEHLKLLDRRGRLRAEQKRRREAAARRQGRRADHMTKDQSLRRYPFKGTDTIIPLNTMEQLEEEGRVMCNCVGTYVRFVAGGRKFIYRVTSPERATLSIEKNNSDIFKIGELRCKSNKDPAVKTYEAVLRWLAVENSARRNRILKRSKSKIKTKTDSRPPVRKKRAQTNLYTQCLLL